MKKRVLLALAALVMTTLSFAQEYMIIENTSGQKARIDVSIIKQVYFETVEQPTPVDPKGTGTLEDPFNVSAAIVKCQELGETPSEETYYIKGIIATIKEEFGAQFGNAYFTISDDGSAANLFTCYRVLFLGNQKWVEGNTQIKVGDEVIICGALVNYRGTTPETAINTAYIYSLNGQTEAGEPSIAPGSTIDNPMTVTQAIAKCQETGETATTDKYYIKGIVDEAYTVNSFKNATFYLVDAEGSESKFMAYRVTDIEGKGLKEGYVIPKGATVILYAQVINYRGTTPETVVNNGYLISVNGQAPEVDGGGDTPTPAEDPKGTGTATDPYNVAAAIAAASALDANVPTENDFYTKGKIAKIRYTYSAQYGTATYYISDDGTENNTFLVYGSYFFGNESWQEGQTQIQVGDEVIVCGKLINYNGTTPEYADKKNWLVSLNGKTSEGGEVTPPTEEIKTATVAEFNAAAESTTVWYKLTGTVKNLKDGDNYGNFDLEDETGSVYVYGLLATKGGEKKKFQDLVTAKGIANDKKITIIGNRGSYNGKIEVLNAYFDSIE